ncbi:MAG TPA: AAA family ATPase, partial [Solirubrobacterales bacterium]|nr:AAA family ATPase [Solirubrobacterales bacterium]
TVLREREHELTELDAAFGDVVAGSGRAVAIEGSPGLGKTRLLREARSRGLGAGLEILSARATELERDFPFSLVRQLFEPRLALLSASELEVLLEGAGAARSALGLDRASASTHDAFSVLHALYWVTATLADEKPILLTIDDAHLADAASLDYLNFVLPRLEELPIGLMLAARPNEPDPSGGVGRFLTDTSVRHLPLAPLSAAATADLLAQELGEEPEEGFAQGCYEVTGGNPFLVCELARSLAEQRIELTAEQAEVVRNLAPEGVSRMVLTRIGRLSAEARAVARALAILGDDSDPALVADLTNSEVDTVQKAADELRAVAILDPSASLRFLHPLIRNSVYADVPAGQRANAHAQAAGLLRSRGAVPERIATQLLASDANGERETVEILVEAGERALATGAPRSAISYLLRAWREPPPPELRATVLTPLFGAAILAADALPIETTGQELIAEVERDPVLRSRFAPQLALMLSIGQGRFEAASVLLREGLEAAEAEGDTERAFQMEVQLNGIAMVGPGSPGQQVNLDRYAGRIDPDSRTGRLAAAMEIFSVLFHGTAEEAADAAHRALANEGAFFAEEPEFVAAGMPVMAFLLAGDLDAAMSGVEQALAVARHHDATSIFVLAWYQKSMVEFNRGDLVAAEADMHQAVDLARLIGLAPAAMLAAVPPLLRIQIERDELESAEAQLAEFGMASGSIPEHPFLGMLRVSRAQLRLERGEFEEAVEDFAMLPAGLESILLGPVALAAVSPSAARAFAAVGDVERAHALSEEIWAIAQRWGAPLTIAQALRTRAAAVGGEDGVALLTEASSLLESSANRLEHAHALFELGATLRRCGCRADSRTPLRESLRLARRCGAIRLAKRVHDELEASGETVRSYTPIGVESLTPSERRVAELAASGMSNRQIAQSLFVTIKTVEAHLSATYDKLDIKSRQEIPDSLEDSLGS